MKHIGGITVAVLSTLLTVTSCAHNSDSNKNISKVTPPGITSQLDKSETNNSGKNTSTSTATSFPKTSAMLPPSSSKGSTLGSTSNSSQDSKQSKSISGPAGASSSSSPSTPTTATSTPSKSVVSYKVNSNGEFFNHRDQILWAANGTLSNNNGHGMKNDSMNYQKVPKGMYSIDVNCNGGTVDLKSGNTHHSFNCTGKSQDSMMKICAMGSDSNLTLNMDLVGKDDVQFIWQMRKTADKCS